MLWKGSVRPEYISTSTMEAKKRVGGEACGAINCTNSRFKCPGKSFYRFPKEEERCRVWVQNTRRQDLFSKSTDRLHKGTLLCEDHFEASQFKTPRRPGSIQKRLIKSAVPTLFNVPDLPTLITSKRGYRAKRLLLDLQSENNSSSSFNKAKRAKILKVKIKLPDKADKCSPHAVPAATQSVARQTNPEVDSSSTSTSAKRAKIVTSPDIADNCGPGIIAGTSQSTDGQTKSEMSRAQSLRKKVKQLQDKLRRLIRKSEKAKNKPYKPITLSKRKKLAIKHLSHLFAGGTFQFMANQVSMAKTQNRGHRWSDEEKSFALSLLHISPKAYQLMKQVLNLPSEVTLRKISRKNSQLFTNHNYDCPSSVVNEQVRSEKSPTDFQLLTYHMFNQSSSVVEEMPLMDSHLLTSHVCDQSSVVDEKIMSETPPDGSQLLTDHVCKQPSSLIGEKLVSEMPPMDSHLVTMKGYSQSLSSVVDEQVVPMDYQSLRNHISCQSPSSVGEIQIKLETF